MQRNTVTNKPPQVQIDKTGHIPQDELINGILTNDARIINRIYREQFDSIKNMVQNFKGLRLEPEDIFQEGLTRAILNVRKGLFKGDSTFSTYLFGICRNICLKEYRRKKPLITIELHDRPEMPEDNHYDTLQVITEIKNRLDENCRKIIDLRFGFGGTAENSKENTKFENIATALQITAGNARQRFKRCFAKFMDMLNKHPEYNLLTKSLWK